MFKAKKISEIMGAEINGIDCSKPLNKKTLSQLKILLERHQFLLFKNQHLDKDQYLAFSRLLGRPGYTRNKFYKDKSKPLISIISNMKEKNKHIGLRANELEFHADSFDYPGNMFNMLMLYAKVAPKQGGKTLFANTCLAYETLPDNLKKLTDKKKILFSCADEGSPHVPRSLVSKNKISRKKGLFIIKLYNKGIVGMPVKESRQLIHKLYKHLTKSSHIYAHQWEVGDILLWNNRTLLHSATKQPKEPRLLWRIQIY